MAWARSWRGVATCGVALVVAAALLTVPVPDDTPAHADAALVGGSMAGARSSVLAQSYLPAEITRLPPGEAAAEVAANPQLAVERASARPALDASDPIEAGLARLLSIHDNGGDVHGVTQAYRNLPPHTTRWLAAVFPGAIGNLSGAAFADRVAANRIRAAAAVEGSRSWPWPDRPWSQTDRKPRKDFDHLNDPGRKFIYFDQFANDRRGSFVEVRGDLDKADHVAVLVPGGSAFLNNNNFGRYSARADSFVKASHGELAVIVWAAGDWPSGWIDEADPSWAQQAAPRLAAFLNDLDRQTSQRDVSVTVAGHSYGGGMVGLAEILGFAADRVLYIASPGAGYGVDEPGDYAYPCRQRFTMLAPGDPVGYVQGVEHVWGLGHGTAVTELPGVVKLTTGYLPDDPQAKDDVGRTLESQGITGQRIAGIHSHSEIFIPGSDAWRNMLAVFSMDNPQQGKDQPPANSAC